MTINHRIDTNIMESEYRNLANAIIIQAAKDYRDTRRILIKKPRSAEAKLRMAGVKRFFLSEWYGALTTVDGKILLKRLEEESA